MRIAPISRLGLALCSSLALLLALGPAGCKDDDEIPVSRFACRCDFLTDMDDASEQRVEVCARDQARAQQRAMGCAQSGAPATVQGCVCEPARSAPGAGSGRPCEVGDCKVHEFR